MLASLVRLGGSVRVVLGEDAAEAEATVRTGAVPLGEGANLFEVRDRRSVGGVDLELRGAWLGKAGVRLLDGEARAASPPMWLAATSSAMVS